jgi:hypothetical protein
MGACPEHAGNAGMIEPRERTRLPQEPLLKLPREQLLGDEPYDDGLARSGVVREEKRRIPRVSRDDPVDHVRADLGSGGHA